MRAIFARSIRACLLSLMLILTLRTPGAAPSIVRSSISTDFSEAICSRVAVPKSTTSEPSSCTATKSSMLPKPISASSRMMRSLVTA